MNDMRNKKVILLKSPYLETHTMKLTYGLGGVGEYLLPWREKQILVKHVYVHVQC